MAQERHDQPDVGQALRRLRDLFHNGKCSDLSVGTYPARHVHKAIVCVESSTIAQICSGELKTSEIVQVDEEGWLSFQQTPDAIVHSVFEFMYVHDDVDYVPNAVSAAKLLDFHLKVYIAAHKLVMPALVGLAGSRACAVINDFADAIRTVYREAPSTAQDLHDKLVTVAVSHADKLLGYRDENTQRLIFRDLLDELTTFGTAFKLSLFELRKGAVRQHFCSLCETGFSRDMRAAGRIHCPCCKRNDEAAQ